MRARNDGSQQIDPYLVEYLVVVVPDERAIESLLDTLPGLTSLGAVEVLDGAIVRRDADGSASVREFPSEAWDRLSHSTPRGILSARDLTMIADALSPSTVGLVVVVEDRWAQPLADAARRVGGEIAGGERIPPSRLQVVLSSLGSQQGDGP